MDYGELTVQFANHIGRSQEPFRRGTKAVARNENTTSPRWLVPVLRACRMPHSGRFSEVRLVSIWLEKRMVSPASTGLIQRVAGTSLAEIEKLISELESLRDLLHAEGQRVQREISGYAQLSQAAMKSTRMIADNVNQWKRAADGLRNS